MFSNRKKRHRRIRAKISGDKDCPRLYVFRSLKHIYAQIIDDEKGKTLVSVNDIEIKNKKGIAEKGKISIASMIGELIAEKAKEKKITKVVFDRGGYKYHGRVKALAEGARSAGLKF